MSHLPDDPDLADADWDQIAAILDAWEEANAAGRDISAEDLCCDCPELLPRVKGILGARRRLAGVGPGGNHRLGTR